MAMSRGELRKRIEKLPRVQLGHFPTPLEYLPRLTEAIGGLLGGSGLGAVDHRLIEVRRRHVVMS